MSRPRRNPEATTPASGESFGSPEVGVSAQTEVTVIAPCILFGTRYSVGDKTYIPNGRVDALYSSGLTVSQAQVDAIWSSAGRILSPNLVTSHYAEHPYDPNALKVLQLTSYDPGSSVYRYHSAANVVSGVTSALVRFGHSNPHCDLRQWDTEIDEATIRVLMMTADVVHSHMDYWVLRNVLRASIGHWKNARTYHGSVDPSNPDGSIYVNKNNEDTKMDAVVFGSRPYHHRYNVKHWLPIPMPVKDYQVLRTLNKPSPYYHNDRPFRIAHSPTVRKIKGTQDIISAVEVLREHEGLNIELVLIENLAHGAALQLKATCDAMFDSFWLGMQGSGLEGAAMNMPVLAGDPEAQADLVKLGIEVPWTVANDRVDLMLQLRRLMSDRTFYDEEARRVFEYVKTYHDYPIVGAKYAKILTEAVRGPANS